MGNKNNFTTNQKKILNKAEYIGDRGMIVTYVLVFGAIALMLLAGLLGFIILQLKSSQQKLAWNESLNIAEAGIDYYRWCLINGIEENCLGVKDFYDNSGNKIGEFEIGALTSLACGQTIQQTIVSTGYTLKFPSVKRKIEVLYARESVAKYSYILNSNVWIGDDHNIRGPYQSNGGIRMDGQNQSLISSAAIYDDAGQWICTSSFGCSPCPLSDGCHTSGGYCICPGVFATTENANQGLFQFPVPPFDFNAITIDLAQIKQSAQTGGLYFGKSNSKGYHLTFQNDGTVRVCVVQNVSGTYAYSIEEDYHYDYFTITGENSCNDYPIPSQCSAIYVEDTAWVEGTVKGKIVLAGANLIDTNIDTDVILPGSIDYNALDGSDGLSLIAERNVLIGPQSPDVMNIDAIIVAQKGRFGRNHYSGNFRSQLNVLGSVISNGRVGTQWSSGSQIISGYLQRETYFDRNQIYNPPPFVSYIDPEFKIVNWREIK